MAVTERKSAGERREQILEAALAEFAAHGLEGGSTEAIAKAVGISQPYVFRLFGTKKELFMATIDARLIAIDAKNGRPLWNIQIAPPEKGYAMTLAPLVMKDKVIIGTAGGVGLRPA